MMLHLAVKLLDDARRTTYEPTLTRHGTVHWCDSAMALESAVAAGAAVAMLEVGSPDAGETLDVLAALRREHPGLLLIVVYDPAGEELREAVRLSLRRLGLWFACEPDDELDLLLANAAAGRIPSPPTPAELAVRCVAELSPAPAARRVAWFHGLTPARHLDEAAAAARCGEKLRTVQRQFADIGVTAGAVRRAFQTLHAAYWLKGKARETGGLAVIFGRRSARALREGVKDVLGVGVQELRRTGGADALCREIVSRLRSESAGKRPHRSLVEEVAKAGGHYHMTPRVKVTLTRDSIMAQLEPMRWALTDVTGAVLVEIVQGRSPSQIVARIQRDYGRTRREARDAVAAALDELSARGVVELDPIRIATLPL